MKFKPRPKLVNDDNALKNPRAPVRVTRILRGDYVFDRLNYRWLKVERLVKVDGLVMIEGTTKREELVRARADECYPSWNPRTQGWGREDGSTRKTYWLT